jgi:SUKH-4 immunity protein
MQPEDIVSFWGKDKLKRFPEESLRDVLIPASSKSFLKDVGLPVGVDWTMRFGVDGDRLPRLSDRSQYRRIGFDDVIPICLDEQHGGQVVSVEQDVGGADRRINANVQRFGECLVYYQRYRTSVQTADKDDIQKIIDATERSLRIADPTAFDDPNNWWPMIIEQMNQGLL